LQALTELKQQRMLRHSVRVKDYIKAHDVRAVSHLPTTAI